MAIRILWHSILMVLRNFGPALVIFGVPTLALICFTVLMLWFGGVPFSVFRGDMAAIEQVGRLFAPGSQEQGLAAARLFLAILVWLVALVLVTCSTVVNWHRYVLLQDGPAVLPRRQLWPYLGWAIIITLIMIGIGWALALLLALFALAIPGWVAILLLSALVLFAMTFISLRIGLALPAAAVGRRMSVSESWSETGRIDGAIAGLALLGMALDVLVGLAMMPLPTQVQYSLSVFIDTVLGLVWISVLTTLYGYLIEKRELTT